MDSKIKVMIADDHSLVRKGLQQILELEEDIEVIGQACDGQEAVDKAIALQPDVILMDINMPKKNGITVIKELKEKHCKSKIIVLTIHDDRQYLLESINSGASGYVMKDEEVDNLIKAIRDVYRGQVYIQPSVNDKLVYYAHNDESKYSDTHDKSLISKLTQRELEVLRLIAEGKNNKEIGDELFISEKTVKNHVSNIFKKIDVCDRTQAAIFVFKNNLI